MNKLVFLLPDLGEGLPDAEIVEWAVQVGDQVKLDGPLLSMETAKAVVDVPSPASGKLIKIYGNKGDVIETGKPLAEFELSDGPQRAQAHDTGHGHGSHSQDSSAASTVANESTQAVASQASAETESADAGSVVGAVAVGHQLVSEPVLTIGGIKAVPAVRALAKKLGVDLARVRGTGHDGLLTLADVKLAASAQVAAGDSARTNAQVAAGDSAQTSSASPSHAAQMRAPATSASAADAAPWDQSENIRGVRRNMARAMAQAHAAVVPTTLTEDADLHSWNGQQDVTARLIRAMVVASRAEPSLNAWFDSKEPSRILHSRVDVGIAVDTDEGLFVPTLRQAQKLSQTEIASRVKQLRNQTLERSLPPSELSGCTIVLSNFGMFAGRYATPVVTPPCVAILAAGRARMQLVPVLGGIATHRMLPLSLTFDHRACTGGEAARWLRSLLMDLELAD